MRGVIGYLALTEYVAEGQARVSAHSLSCSTDMPAYYERCHSPTCPSFRRLAGGTSDVT